MAQLDGQIYLTTQQVANALKITKTTLKNWLRKREIDEPKRHPANGYRLWTQQDVENIRLWIAHRQEGNE